MAKFTPKTHFPMARLIYSLSAIDYNIYMYIVNN